MILRDNQTEREKVKDLIKALYSELLNSETDEARAYSEWVLKKYNSNRRSAKEKEMRDELKRLNPSAPDYAEKEQSIRKDIKKVLHTNYPDSLEKGDIIHVSYGVGFGDELSDDHYGIIISRLGTLFLVAPLTKTYQPFKENNVTFIGLSLPGEDDTKTSYVSFSQIRYVHKRRIEKINGITNGKKHIDTTRVDEIMSKFNNIIKANEK